MTETFKNNKDAKEGYSSSDAIKTDFIELGRFFYSKLRSPYTIIGLGIILFAILVSIFPQILTPYSLSEAIGIDSGQWAPPSFQHPLGQSKFGRDVLAIIVYGITDALLFSTFSVLLGFVGVLIISIPVSLLNRRLKFSTEIVLIPLMTIPLVILSVFGFFIFNSIYFAPLFYGIYFIPIIVYFIGREQFTVYNIGKTLISYIPLLMGYTVLMYTFMGFLGFASNTIQIGNEIIYGHTNLSGAPWASLFPSLAVFVFVSGFFLLYIGLQKSPDNLLDLN